MLTLLELLPEELLLEELLLLLVLVLVLVELLLPDLPALSASLGARVEAGAIGASLHAAAARLVSSASAPTVV
ncbi:MAG: hypothetical protein ACXW0Z_18260 [Gemmatirosa sp.]